MFFNGARRERVEDEGGLGAAWAHGSALDQSVWSIAQDLGATDEVVAGLRAEEAADALARASWVEVAAPPPSAAGVTSPDAPPRRRAAAAAADTGDGGGRLSPPRMGHTAGGVGSPPLAGAAAATPMSGFDDTDVIAGF